MKKILPIALATTLLFTGCSSSAQGEVEQGEDTANTLVIAIQEEIEGTDIHQIGWENVVHYLLFDSLINFSEDLSEVQPGFAKEFHMSEDGTELTFTLHENSKFSNGDPLTAESVKASAERMREISPYSGDLDPVESIEVVDENTVKYILSEPAPFMMASLTSGYGGIVHAELAETMGNDEFNRAAVGNGPYMIKEWQAGSQIILEKNPHYVTANPAVNNKGALNFDTIIVRFIPDEFTRVSELESGDVDIIYNVPIASIDSLSANSELAMYEYAQPGSNYLIFQTDDGVTSDLAVRQAINIGIDRETLAKSLDNVIAPLYGFLSPAQAGFSADKEEELAETYKYDLDGAKKILADAGYADSNGDGILEKDGQDLSFEFATPLDSATNKSAAPIIQAQLKELGIDAQIREYESAYIKEIQRSNEHQMAFRTNFWNDADILYYVFTEYSGYPWHSEAVTAALTEARYQPDEALRIAAYEKAHDALFEEVPAIALYADNYYVATKGNLSGLVVTNDGRIFYNDLVKE